MGQHLIQFERLGLPQGARDVFTQLANAGWIEAELAQGLKALIGFRNIAVHQYQCLLQPITVKVITDHLDECLQYSAALLRRDQTRS